MRMSDLLKPDDVVAALKAKDKKDALRLLAEAAAARTGRSEPELYEKLLQRERLGSTGVGRGIAIPHLRIAGLDRIVCVFARLEAPIDFASLDDEPVDLIFVLLTPEDSGGDHLKALARISRLMREPGNAQKLRKARDTAALYAVLVAADTDQPIPLAG
jgi:PTS system nitrogen regulatory IIA component